MPGLVKIETGRFSSNTMLPIPSGFVEDECKFYWSNPMHSSDTSAIQSMIAAFGVTREAKMPHGREGVPYGRKGGAWLVIAAKEGCGVEVSTGMYGKNTMLPIPAGFVEDECHFYWSSHGRHYGDENHCFGVTREAKMPFGGALLDPLRGGAWIVIATKEGSPVKVMTGTHNINTHLPIPAGSVEEACSFFWSSHEDSYPNGIFSVGLLEDVILNFGTERLATMPYGGTHGRKGGAWLVVAVQEPSLMDILPDESASQIGLSSLSWEVLSQQEIASQVSADDGASSIASSLASWILAPGGNSFMPETLFKVTAGFFLPAWMLTRGSQVVAGDGHSVLEVSNARAGTTDKIVELTSGSYTLKTTPTHRMKVPANGDGALDREVQAGDLKVGDEVICYPGNTMRLTQVAHLMVEATAVISLGFHRDAPVAAFLPPPQAMLSLGSRPRRTRRSGMNRRGQGAAGASIDENDHTSIPDTAQGMYED